MTTEQQQKVQSILQGTLSKLIKTEKSKAIVKKITDILSIVCPAAIAIMGVVGFNNVTVMGILGGLATVSSLAFNAVEDKPVEEVIEDDRKDTESK